MSQRGRVAHRSAEEVPLLIHMYLVHPIELRGESL